MAYVNTGANYEWITPAEGVAVSDFSEDEFTVGEDGLPEYTGNGYDTRLGIDVSFYQGEIDWQARGRLRHRVRYDTLRLPRQ